ncbi:hypothetical protein E5Q_04638 [Mixia osmundae IAM 14324]|uniref:SUN domain-containing protein n=1 Tax=Mixia osmundae (strain CBS 9802 / IAM 14324 / JCM 22182 / KY 12970) TaxID=764103 RepID=G7E548_MIXOS|nr:hypothetical protein E5Q_04638 [Mixia osmundae IAM 14324]
MTEHEPANYIRVETVDLASLVHFVRDGREQDCNLALSFISLHSHTGPGTHPDIVPTQDTATSKGLANSGMTAPEIRITAVSPAPSESLHHIPKRSAIGTSAAGALDSASQIRLSGQDDHIRMTTCSPSLSINHPRGKVTAATRRLDEDLSAYQAEHLDSKARQTQRNLERSPGSPRFEATSGDNLDYSLTESNASESDDAEAYPVPGRYGIIAAQALKRAYASLDDPMVTAALIAIAFAMLSMLYSDKLIQLKNPAQTEARDLHLLSSRVASLTDAHDLLSAQIKQTYDAFADELLEMNDTLSRVQSQSETLSKMMVTIVEKNGQLKQSFEHLSEQVQERCASDERGALSGVATQQVRDMIKEAMKEQMGESLAASGEVQTAASIDVSAVFETVKRSLVEELQADIYKNSNGNGSLSHDDGMRTVLQKAVQREVAIAQDGVAMSDVALASAGARVIKKWTGKSFIKTTNPIKKWYATRHPFRPPEYAMDIDRTAGHCWAFNGNRTTLGIQFGGPVYITHISLDHAPRSVWPSVAIAPKDFEVWGILNDDTDRPYWNLVRQSEEQRLAVLKYGDDRGKMVYLTNGTYTPADDYFGATQTWPIVASAKELNLAYEMILLKITSTHGAENGCLYRFRVHGGLKYREGFNRTSIV